MTAPPAAPCQRPAPVRASTRDRGVVSVSREGRSTHKRRAIAQVFQQHGDLGAMGKPMFAAQLDPDELAHIADRAAEVFVAAHGRSRTDQVSVSLTGALIFVPSRAKSW